MIRTHRDHRRRSGTTLMEMLVLLSVLSLLLGLCGGMIHLLLKLDRSERTASDEAADMVRLARDFRADVHAATAPHSAKPDRLDLPGGGGRTIEYEARPADILRTVREGEKIRHRETYRRPARSSVRFTLTADGSARLAAVVIDRALNGTDGSLYHDLRIEAVVGSDGRYSARAPQ